MGFIHIFYYEASLILFVQNLRIPLTQLGLNIDFDINW